jgi:NADPH-dependent stearoyl-CoA 9-desaturase
VRQVCERYGIPYNTGPLRKQFGSVVRKIARLALPDRRERPVESRPSREAKPAREEALVRAGA